MRRVVLAVCAVATILLGLERTSVMPLFPEEHLGLDLASSGDDTLTLSQDAGTIDCTVRLRSSTLPEKALPAVSFENGRMLSITKQNRDGVLWWIVHDSADAPGDLFQWPADARLRFHAKGSKMGTLGLSELMVSPAEGPHDSLFRTSCRKVWGVIAIGLLVLTLLGVFLTAWAEWDARTVVTAEYCITSLIGSVEGTESLPRRAMRKYLKRVVVHQMNPIDVIRTMMSSKVPFHQAFQIGLQADHQFRGHLNRLLAGLLMRMDDLKSPYSR